MVRWLLKTYKGGNIKVFDGVCKYEINHLENIFTPLEYVFLLLFAFGLDLHNKQLSFVN